ncbi:hypothetical protein [Streptomyces sp. NPDC020607]|uniref:hypothetical protein n=1 Tax=Streptomyces sp. NPDC020607 TaxID=3365082 RepID=UPI00379B7817
MRRGVRNVLGAGAAVLCLGGLLSACGDGGGDDGYVATGAVPERARGQAVGPDRDVKLVPLDEEDGDSAARRSGRSPSSASAGPRGGGGSEGKSPASAGSSSPGARTEGRSGSPSAPGAGAGSPGADGPGSQAPQDPQTPRTPQTPQDPKPGPEPDPEPGPPSGPAALSVGDPDRKPADKRWCENVTVAFHNTGGAPVRSGTVTLGTHVIGALGVDWATIESTVKLPAPIGPGQKKKKTWPVCVDAWRVPLGMHVETRDVTVKWR